MENIILEKMADQNGNEFVSDYIFNENGVYYRQSVNCLSSADLDLGTCRCVSHDPWMIRPCTLDELSGHGIELTYAERLAQILAIANTDLDEMVQFCALSYKFGQNPLPAIRSIMPGFSIQFHHQTDSRSAFLTPPKPTIAIELADDGRVWIEKYTEWHEGLKYFVPEN